MLLVTLAGIAICAAGVFAAAEHFAAGPGGETIRLAIYQGGMAGGVLGLSGLPFAIILSRIDTKGGNDAAFWKWWGSGLLTRLVLLGVFSKILDNTYALNEYQASSTTMIVIYLIGMFSEVAWLAKVLLKNEPSYKKA